MPRIRSIKPEFVDSEALGRVSRDARLTYLLLTSHADDAGRLRGNHRFLAHKLFPYDSDAEEKISSWMDELEAQQQIQTYRLEGESYVSLTNWPNEQKIDHPQPSRLPAPPTKGQVEMPFELAADENPSTDQISEIAGARRRRNNPLSS